MMYTVAEPRVLSTANSASRKEIPSRPGLRFSAAIEDVLPLTTSAVVVTTTMLGDTDTAREPAARAEKPAAQITASTVAMPAAIFTEASAPPASMVALQTQHQGSRSARPTASATMRTPVRRTTT